MKSLELYENYTSLSSVWKNGMHSIVMHRFMVQAFQDLPFCSSTVFRPQGHL
jgi:hypothetical protein